MMAAVSVDRARCTATAPSWCSWMPFADSFSACKPLSPEELEACQRLEMGGHMPASEIEQALARGRETTEAYCRVHSEECAAWRASTGCPTISASLGPALARALGCGDGEPVLLYYLAAGLGLLAVVLILRR